MMADQNDTHVMDNQKNFLPSKVHGQGQLLAVRMPERSATEPVEVVLYVKPSFL